jgi:hypothetical protein
MRTQVEEATDAIEKAALGYEQRIRKLERQLALEQPAKPANAQVQLILYCECASPECVLYLHRPSQSNWGQRWLSTRLTLKHVTILQTHTVEATRKKNGTHIPGERKPT